MSHLQQMAQQIEDAAQKGQVLRVRYRNLNGERSRRDILPVTGLCWDAGGASANFNAFSFVLEHSRRNYTESGFFPFRVDNITALEGPTGVVVSPEAIGRLVHVPAEHVLVFPGPDAELDSGKFQKPEAVHKSELDYYISLGFQTTPWIGTVTRPAPQPWTPRGAEVRNSMDRQEIRNPFDLL